MRGGFEFGTRVFMQFNTGRAQGAHLTQFNNLGLNFVTFRKHSAQKLSKTVWTGPCGVLNVSELKRESVLIGASYYGLPVSHVKWQALLGQRKTPKPQTVFGPDFALHDRRYGSGSLLFEFG